MIWCNACILIKRSPFTQHHTINNLWNCWSARTCSYAMYDNRSVRHHSWHFGDIYCQQRWCRKHNEDCTRWYRVNCKYPSALLCITALSCLSLLRASVFKVLCLQVVSSSLTMIVIIDVDTSSIMISTRTIYAPVIARVYTRLCSEDRDSAKQHHNWQ